MEFSWTIFIDLGLISAALLVATYIRAKVPFFQKYLIPNALTAGFILLPIYNFIMPRLGLNSQGLENLVFHLLCISFIAMSLRGGESKGAGRRVFSSAVLVVAHYTLQAIIGFGLTMLFMYTVVPGLFPNFGFFLPLGFGLGPGQSFAIGKGWEAFGFEKAANLGLIFAAIGYVWGAFGSVLLVNIARRRGWMDVKRLNAIDQKRIRMGLFGPKETKPVGSKLTTETEAIDTMSYTLAVIFGVYLVAYLLLRLLSYVLSLAGPMGSQLATNFWGIAFVFAAVVALLAKTLFKKLKIDFTLDEGSLNRITGVSVDLMVAAAVGAIAIVVFTRYWIPIVVIVMVGGVLTTLASVWLTCRIFRDHRFDWVIMIYGNMTGTLTTGLAFLRVLDPDYESPVARDYVYSTGLIFVICIPYILMLNLPAYWHSSGNPLYLWLTLAIIGAYLIFSLVAYTLLSGKRAFKQFFSLWLKD